MKKLIALLIVILAISCAMTACIPAPTLAETGSVDNWNQNNYYNDYYVGTDASPSGYQPPKLLETQSNTSETTKFVSTQSSGNYGGAVEGAMQATACSHQYRIGEANCEKCNEPHPNVLATSVQLPQLPKEVSKLNIMEEPIHTTKVTKIEISVEYYKEDVRIVAKFTGTKTYDRKGDSNSSSCYVGYKLYDMEGNVVDSDTFFSPDVTVGEGFSNQSDIITTCPPGKYRLELVDAD